jgi:hypothetical protein
MCEWNILGTSMEASFPLSRNEVWHINSQPLMSDHTTHCLPRFWSSRNQIHMEMTTLRLHSFRAPSLTLGPPRRTLATYDDGPYPNPLDHRHPTTTPTPRARSAPPLPQCRLNCERWTRASPPISMQAPRLCQGASSGGSVVERRDGGDRSGLLFKLN